MLMHTSNIARKKSLENEDNLFDFSNRIVGDDDGGKLFTPEEYDEYKRRVLPMV
jgi:hypothetical protein